MRGRWRWRIRLLLSAMLILGICINRWFHGEPDPGAPDTLAARPSLDGSAGKGGVVADPASRSEAQPSELSAAQKIAASQAASAGTEKSISIQGTRCLTAGFPLIHGDSKSLSLQDLLSSGEALPQPVSISLTVESESKTYWLLAESSRAPDSTDSGTVSSQAPFVIRIHESTSSDRPHWLRDQAAASLGEVFAVFPRAKVLTDERTYRGLGAGHATVVTRDGLLEEIGLPPPSSTRCQVENEMLACHCDSGE